MAYLEPSPYPGLASISGSFNAPRYPLPSAYTPESQPNVAQQCEENQRLIATIRETEGNTHSFAKHEEFVKDLRSQLSQLTEAHEGMKRSRQKAEYELQKLAGSKIKNGLMSMKILGKDGYERKKDKEEQEYVVAKKAEDDSIDQIASIRSMIDEAMKVHVDLESQSQRHTAAQDQLDSLQRRIFDGPTPEAPEEDRLEWLFNQRRAVFEQATYHKHREEFAVRSLQEADLKLQQALSFIKPALDRPDMDRWIRDKAGYTRRDLILKVEMNYQYARHSVDIARLSNSSVGDLVPVSIPGTRAGDIYLKNNKIIRDSDYHHQVKKTAVQLKSCMEKLRSQMDQAQSRLQQITEQQNQEKTWLNSARRALQEERAKAFEHVMKTRFGQRG